MANSKLIDKTFLSPNVSSPRSRKIDTITIHCTDGEMSIESMGRLFQDLETKASCNYGIGNDGRIGLYCEEGDRSWCSSNRANDHRAITIECSSKSGTPHEINNEVFNSLIKLLVDVCKRNKIKKLLWENNSELIGNLELQNITVHKWFKPTKECPGDYIINKMYEIVYFVNKELQNEFLN